jgi:hypothetical protein
VEHVRMPSVVTIKSAVQLASSNLDPPHACHCPLIITQYQALKAWSAMPKRVDAFL